MKQIPEFLLKKIKEQYPIDYENIIKGYESNRYSSLRINTIKTTQKEIEDILSKHNIKYEIINDIALIIDDDINKIKELDIYKDGKIYLQSLSSMIPPFIVNPKPQELILDMTAAPGGKTTQMAALSNNQAMITATEKNKIRSDRLKYNIEKQGAKKINILNVDARKLDEYFKFDKILLDAPCSGSGTLNINDDSINNFNEDLVNRSIKFQTELINEAVKHLNNNGELIYSTCSILKEENEEIIDKVIKEHNLEIIPITELNKEKIPCLPSTIEGVITICPTNYYEGFFVAKLKKKQ